jgi:hypothetical protein
MEEYYNVKRLALVLSIQAEIEGMKVQNLLEPNTYTKDDFFTKAELLRLIAYAHNEQL